MDASAVRHASRERLVNDLNNVATDVEQMLSATGAHAGEAYDAAMARMKDAIATAKTKLNEVEHRAVDKTRAAAHATDVYVHDNAWKAVALAALTGFVAGLLLSRR